MTLRTVRPLTWLMAVSLAILLAGAVALGAGIAMQNALWQVIGLLGLIAGVVKVAVVVIWSRVAGLGRDDYTPTPSP